MKPTIAYATLLYLMFASCLAFAQPNFNSSPPSMLPYAQPEEVFASPVMPQVTPPRATEADYANFDLNSSVRIKDITFIEGERINHLSGEGLVFGLSGTGGRAEQTRRMASNYFLRKGLQVRTVDTQNMSAVLVSGRIPAYARKGETILVTVSVADDATSLRGGTLHQTVLRGIDDEIYAVAQGPVIGSGIAAQGQAASVQSNHPTVGVCEAIVEREIPCQNIVRGNAIRLILRNKSYSTATVIMNALNTVFPGHANALDSGTVEVVIPNSFRDSLPTMISMIGDLRVTPDLPARVVINQKTGTIVLGHDVRVSPVVFACENIVIASREDPLVSQPAPFSDGTTEIVPRTSIDIAESGGRYQVWPQGMTVGELANALNLLGVSPNTMITIMSSLRNQGALQAELIIE